MSSRYIDVVKDKYDRVVTRFSIALSLYFCKTLLCRTFGPDMVLGHSCPTPWNSYHVIIFFGNKNCTKRSKRISKYIRIGSTMEKEIGIANKY